MATAARAIGHHARMRFPDDVPTLTDGVVTLRAHAPVDAREWSSSAATRSAGSGPRCARPNLRETPSRSSGTSCRRAGPGGGGRSRSRRPTPTGRTVLRTVELRDEGAGRAEVAFGAHPWARGRGLMTRAVGLLLDWGFASRTWHGDLVGAPRQLAVAAARLAARVQLRRKVRSWLPNGESCRRLGRCPHRGDCGGRVPPGWEAPVVTGEASCSARTGARPPPPAGGRGRTRRSAACWPTSRPRSPSRPRATTWRAAPELAATGTGVGLTAADPSDDGALLVPRPLPGAPRPDAEVGYFAHPDARGRGLTPGGGGRVCRHAFVPVEDGGMGLRRLTAAHPREERRITPDRGGGGLPAGRTGALGRTQARRLAGRRVSYDLLPEELRRARPDVAAVQDRRQRQDRAARRWRARRPTQLGAVWPQPAAITSPPSQAPRALAMLSEAWLSAAPRVWASPATCISRICRLTTRTEPSAATSEDREPGEHADVGGHREQRQGGPMPRSR